MGVGKVLGGLAGGLAGLVLPGLFSKPKPQKAPLQAPPQAQRSSVINDELASRRGSTANQRSSGPQENARGKKTQLGG